jgi:hypothetical protein
MGSINAEAREDLQQLQAELARLKSELANPPDVDYKPIAQAAGLDDHQLRLIEQLFNTQNSTDIFAAQMRVYSACERIRDRRASKEAVPHLLEKRSNVEKEIKIAFAGVTRDGGTSWSEGWAIDDGASDEACQAARASDREQSWEQLVDDPNWHYDNGPWSFLDAIGFRYYLAPAMIREARGGSIGSFAYSLDHPIYEDELRTLLTPAQQAAIHHFLQYIREVMATFQWPDDDNPTVQQLSERWNVKTA